MKQKKCFMGLIALSLLIMMPFKSPAIQEVKSGKLKLGTSLIFKGTILLLNTVTTDEDDVSNSGVVLVTEVIDAPESFKNITGQQITVRFSDIKQVKAGEERMFFTEPYFIGETLGVIEKGSVLKGEKLYESKDILSYITAVRAKQDDEQLKRYMLESKLVITGRVVSVNEPEGNQRMATEHDPEWKEAEIQIDECLKGKLEVKSVKILFASGHDVMFYQSPKFTKGDEGIFIVRQTDSRTLKLLRNDNMLIDKDGFIRGKEKVEHIKKLLK
ncbi:MAG: hypothetical protein U0W24_19075 [Bacteroidales bacterium]